MLPMPTKVMIVEDEMMAQRHIQNILKSLNIDVAGCYDNAADARAALTKDSCDMILMDINIKGSEDGIQFSRSILQQYQIPIVFISAYSDAETLSEVLELSPYGFITKPFGAKDVEVAMGIAYQRFNADKHKPAPVAPKAPDDVVQIGEDFRFDTKARMLYHQEQGVRLNKKQIKLIEVLIAHGNQIVDYDTILEAVWPDGVFADSSLRTLIYSVRQILPDFPLESHSKMGYALKSVDLNPSA